jgi:hypothetical protein
MGVSQNIISFAKFLIYVSRFAALGEGSGDGDLSICGGAASASHDHVTVILRISKICSINNNRLHQKKEEYDSSRTKRD